MWWVSAPTHSRIEDSVVPAAIIALQFLGLKPNIDYRVNKSIPQTIWLLRSEQQIRFISGDRPELIVSATIGGYFITEAGITKQEVFENLEDRTRSIYVDRQLSIIEGTPEGDNYYKSKFDIKKSDPARLLRRFILHTSDNASNLAPGYVKRLKRTYAHSQAQIDSYLYGLFTSFRSGDVFGQYVESRNVIDDVPPDPNKTIHLCVDFNATPLTWSAWQLIPYAVGGALKMREACIAESSLNCTNLLQAAVEFGLEFAPEIFVDAQIHIWGDRTGHAKSHKVSGTDFGNLKNYLNESFRNVTIRASRKVTPIRASVDVFNRLLLYELILICARCKNMRRSLNNTRWASGQDDIEKRAGETHTHHSDGARYRIWDLYKQADINDLLTATNVHGINPA